MGMTTWEWEGLGILKAIPAHLYRARNCGNFCEWLYCMSIYYLLLEIFQIAADMLT